MVNEIKPNLLDSFSETLGEDIICLDTEIIKEQTKNSLGITRNVLGIVYPKNVEEVKRIVDLANELNISLYPLSRGRNIGYGDKLPVTDNQIIVDLQKMNKIREFDSTLGEIVIEPGVTQKQILDFLKNKPFVLSASMAPLDASILGNTLEGGMGNTSRGNRRHNTCDYEVVLGNGTIVRTGAYGMGPDLSQLFIQSNFGIVTSIRITLMPEPESFCSFSVQARKDSDLELLIGIIRQLRQKDTINSICGIVNSIRSMAFLYDTLPKELRNSYLTNTDAQKILSNTFVKAGYWIFTAAIFGSKEEVKAKKRVVKKAFGKIGKILFFNDRSISFLKKLTSTFPFGKIGIISKINKMISVYEHGHNLMKGYPSDGLMNLMKWRVTDFDSAGLIWYAPVVETKSDKVRLVISTAQKLFEKYSMEYSVSVISAMPNKTICLLNIYFDKNNPEEKNRAYELYSELHHTFEKLDIHPYRSCVMKMLDIQYKDIGKHKTLNDIKSILDSNNIISPGRYGITLNERKI